MSFLKTIDYFSIPQSFKVNNKKKYGSSIGGLVFLIYVCLSIFYTVYKSIPFIMRENVNLVFNEQVILPAPTLDFRELQFRFATQLVDRDNRIANEEVRKYFSHTLEFIQYENANPMVPIKIPLRPCSEPEDFSYIQDENKETMSKVFELEEYLCPSNLDMKIGGLLTVEKYEIVSLKIEVKQEYNNRSDLEMLSKLLRQQPLQSRIIFKDTSLDVNNLGHPISFFANNFATSISIEHNKDVNLDYMYFSLVDDQNFFEIDSFEKVYIKFMGGFTDITSIDRNQTDSARKADLVNYIFKSNPTVRKMERRYTKFPAFLAELSVILSNGIVILVIFMQFVNEFQLDKEIMNQIFEFKYNLNRKVKNQMQSILGEKRDDSNQFKNSVGEIIPNTRTTATAMKRSQSKKKKQVVLSFWSCLSTCNGRCRTTSKQQQIYLTGLKNLNEYFNIFSVIRMMQEFEVHRSILFTPVQQEIIRFLAKPVLSVDTSVNVKEAIQVDEFELKLLNENIARLESANKSVISLQIKALLNEKLRAIID